MAGVREEVAMPEQSPPSVRPGARVLVVSGSVGAGHDGAARELAARLERRGVDVTVRDLLAAVPAPVAALLRDGYTTSVSRVPAAFELLFRRLEHRGLLWRATQRICASAERAVVDWVDETQPDLVVSTYPLASQTLGELRASGRLAVPVLTYLTDPAVHVSWLHPAVDGHLTVTAATAWHGEAAYGGTFTVAGPLAPERFRTTLPLHRLVALRTELGIAPGRPVALLVAGSLGLGDLRPTVRDLLAAGTTPLVLCGRNERVRRQVARQAGAVALGWRDDVDQLMQVADVLVHNAGGLSFTEALVAGLPAVTYRPIPGHGRANARVLDETGIAPWARTPGELAERVHEQLGAARRPSRYADPADLVVAALPRPDRPAKDQPATDRPRPVLPTRAAG
jgi:processive 1,2-diacylglycerol beta-glucosyltransferase